MHWKQDEIEKWELPFPEMCHILHLFLTQCLHIFLTSSVDICPKYLIISFGNNFIHLCLDQNSCSNNYQGQNHVIMFTPFLKSGVFQI